MRVQERRKAKLVRMVSGMQVNTEALDEGVEGIQKVGPIDQLEETDINYLGTLLRPLEQSLY